MHPLGPSNSLPSDQELNAPRVPPVGCMHPSVWWAWLQWGCSRGAGPPPVAYVVLPHGVASGSPVGGAGSQDG